MEDVLTGGLLRSREWEMSRIRSEATTAETEEVPPQSLLLLQIVYESNRCIPTFSSTLTLSHFLAYTSQISGSTLPGTHRIERVCVEYGDNANDGSRKAAVLVLPSCCCRMHWKQKSFFKGVPYWAVAASAGVPQPYWLPQQVTSTASLHWWPPPLSNHWAAIYEHQKQKSSECNRMTEWVTSWLFSCWPPFPFSNLVILRVVRNHHYTLTHLQHSSLFHIISFT